MKFNDENIKVGDYVNFDNGIICGIMPRKTFFNRTNVANITLMSIVIAPVPQVDFMLVDKLIIEGINGGAEVAIIVNKCDLSNELYEYCIKNYQAAVDKILKISTVTGEGLDELKNYTAGKFCALAGQSAVGKTSIINCLFGTRKEVNSVSEKTLRGRHTTTTREIHYGENFSVIDTPGFSAISTFNIESSALLQYYRDFERYSRECFFTGCTHTAEPNCSVKKAVCEGLISSDRYNRYCFIYKDVKNYEKRKY